MKQPLNIKRILMVCLGAFWLLDGILQLQPPMFTKNFISQVLAPNLQNQPGIIASIITVGIHIFSLNIFWFNLVSALVQLIIGALLVLPLPKTLGRLGLWLSVIWGLIIWIFGEGLGNLATGSASFYSGAPGSVVLYIILAIFLLYAFDCKKLPTVAGWLLILSALLNLTPMFWQQGMLSMMSMIPAVSAPLGTIGAQGTVIGNFLAIDVLVFLGIFLIMAQSRFVAWFAIIFIIAVWWLGQNFGGLGTFPFGTATDPNTAPLFILFLLPIFFGNKNQITAAEKI